MMFKRQFHFFRMLCKQWRLVAIIMVLVAQMGALVCTPTGTIADHALWISKKLIL